MKKISAELVEELVERRIVEAGLDQYGDMFNQIRLATFEELASRGIEVTGGNHAGE